MITSPSMMGSHRDKSDNGQFEVTGSGAPISGTAGTGVGVCGLGSVYTNLTNGVRYINEGTSLTPYWTPMGFDQFGLLGMWTDFRDGVGKAHADTAAGVTLVGSGARIFGLGVAQTDSGVVVTLGANGAKARMTSSATTNLPCALSFMGSTVPFVPGTNGTLVVDAKFTVVTDLLTKRVILGFVGTAADGLVSPVTGSTVTLTLVQGDVSCMMFDSGLTDAVGIMLPHNKATEAATIATTATSVDTGVDIAAVATYTRWRIEITPTGTMIAFVDKVQVGSIDLSASTTVAVSPVLLVSGTSSAVDALDVRHFATWGTRIN